MMVARLLRPKTALPAPMQTILGSFAIIEILLFSVHRRPAFFSLQRWKLAVSRQPQALAD